MDDRRVHAEDGGVVLRRVVGLLLGAVLGAAGLLALGAPAVAAECVETQERFDPATGEFTVVCVQWDDGGGGDAGPGDGGGSGSGGERECRYRGSEVPCTDDILGTWVNAKGCYMAVASFEPSENNIIGEKQEGDVVLRCNPPFGLCENFGNCSVTFYWSSSVPQVPAPPDPEELAERAAARIAGRLSMGQIGSTPPSKEMKSDSVGLVGVPIWLWVADPGESTTGPINESETDGGLTVTATGALDRIVWELADETGEVYRTVECVGDDAAGTVWSEELGDGGRAPSPTCGFDGWDNSRTGRLTLTGTAYWSITWSGGGQEGTIDVPALTRSAPLDMGEVQVIVQ